jgi:hypothetical protein
MIRPVEFDAAQRARQASYGRYRLTPREAYALLSAPIRGHERSERRRREGATGGSWTMWLVGDENLTAVVDGLLLRGLLARRVDEGLVYADLTAEGQRAIDVGRLRICERGED